jgi:hypothetical protein
VDVKVSRKETRYQPTGAVDVLMSDVTDFFPVFDGDKITDIEILDNYREELLDRAMWAAFKQLGLDPLDTGDGNQWEECILGEVSVVALMAQITANVAEEGVGVQVSFETSTVEGKDYLVVNIFLSNTV